jgi:hypothetical protein
MKKLLRLLPLILFAALALTACSGQGFVQLPDTVQAGITAVILWAVSWLFVQLITLVPWLAFLDEFKTPLAMAIAAALIGWIQNAVPDAYGAVAILAIQLVLAILALFKVGEVLQKRNVRGFKARK